ncbi:M48 family metalloprotease [bacterium]|nr:M48 family metalloprotease [bacterium]
MSFSRRNFILPVVGMAMLISIACATSERSSLKANTGGAIISEQKELDLGRAVAQEVLREFTAYDDEDLNAYVDRVGQAVARVSDRSNIPYRFTVLDHPAVNAFAAPGGYIFVTRGLLSTVQNEAQLAAILGHEVGHVVERHAMKRLQAQAVAFLGQLAMAVKGGGAPAGAGDMVALIMLGYGREDEYHADALGVKYAYDAGYDPKELLDFFDLLKAEQVSAGIGEPSSVQELVWSHPPPTKRTENTRQAIENLKLWQAGAGLRRNPAVGVEPYEEALSGHSYRDDKSQLDKILTLIYTAYQAEDVEKLMSYVSRDYEHGKSGYYDLEKDLRFFFTHNDQIRVDTKKKEVRLKDSRTAFIHHVYVETFFDRAKSQETTRTVKERLWFVKKSARWLLTGVENNPK